MHIVHSGSGIQALGNRVGNALQVEFSDDAAGILVPSNMSIVIGHKHIKALFEEYTDASFSTKKVCNPLPPRSPPPFCRASYMPQVWCLA